MSVMLIAGFAGCGSKDDSKSNDVGVKSITSNKGTVVTTAGAYTLDVAYDVTAVTLTVETSSGDASVVSGASINVDLSNVLQGASTTAVFTVKAENGDTKEYTVTITKTVNEATITAVTAYGNAAGGDLSTQAKIDAAKALKAKIVTTGLTTADVAAVKVITDAADAKVAAAQKVIDDQKAADAIEAAIAALPAVANLTYADKAAVNAANAKVTAASAEVKALVDVVALAKLFDLLDELAVIEADVTDPVVTLTGSANITLYVGATYTEYGATAVDAADGVVEVTVTGTVNTSKAGIYTITYTAKDRKGNEGTAERTVTVIDKPLTSDLKVSPYGYYTNLVKAIYSIRIDVNNTDIVKVVVKATNPLMFEDTTTAASVAFVVNSDSVETGEIYFAKNETIVTVEGYDSDDNLIATATGSLEKQVSVAYDAIVEVVDNGESIFPGANNYTVSIEVTDSNIKTVDVYAGTSKVGTITINELKGTKNVIISNGTTSIKLKAKDADGNEIGTILQQI